MSIKAQLEEVVQRTAGTVGILIFDRDGLLVEKALTEQAGDLEVVFVELLGGFKTIDSSAASIQLGSTSEINMTSGNRRYLVRRLAGEYYIFLVMTLEGNLGEGRYRLKRTAESLAGEFEV